MRRIKVVCAFGTRPETIKMAPVVQELKRRPQFGTRVIVTGQHRHMLDQMLRVFKIKPDGDLDVMKPAQDLYDITGRVLSSFGRALRSNRPDLVLVHGDTTTTLACTLAAFYEHIPVGHVEAGLRTYDYMNPFPEEANRRLADQLCAMHFAPTSVSRAALLKENLPRAGIYVTGNTVIDAVLQVGRRPHDFREPALRRLSGQRGRILVVTAHRRENFGGPLKEICNALLRLVRRFDDLKIVYPVHLNPNVRNTVMKALRSHKRIILLEPLDYVEFVHLMKISTALLTDSGGLQEEGPAFHKPVLVMRKVTERPEAVAAGTARVVGVMADGIYRAAAALLANPALYRHMSHARNPFGDGRASGRIADAILHYFGRRAARPADFR